MVSYLQALKSVLLERRGRGKKETREGGIDKRKEEFGAWMIA